MGGLVGALMNDEGLTLVAATDWGSSIMWL